MVIWVNVQITKRVSNMILVHGVIFYTVERGINVLFIKEKLKNMVRRGDEEMNDLGAIYPETIVSVVRKLVGDIHAVGETHIDNENYEHLKVMGKVVNMLLDDIMYEATNVNRWEGSVIRNAEKALDILKDIKAEVDDTLKEYGNDR